MLLCCINFTRFVLMYLELYLVRKRPLLQIVWWQNGGNSTITLHIMLHHATSCYITLHHATSRYIMLHHATSCYITLYHAPSIRFGLDSNFVCNPFRYSSISRTGNIFSVFVMLSIIIYVRVLVVNYPHNTSGQVNIVVVVGASIIIREPPL
jgi:hypothetical protein